MTRLTPPNMNRAPIVGARPTRLDPRSAADRRKIGIRVAKLAIGVPLVIAMIVLIFLGAVGGGRK